MAKPTPTLPLPLHIFTIVKNGMPWITCHYPSLRRLSIPWTWHIVEGTALNENCTSWCTPQPPGLSTDGTTEYLDSLRFDPRIHIHRSEAWHGKLEMVNAPLRHLLNPVILLQVDSDELWTTEQLTTLHSKLSTGKKNSALFYCRYYLGRDIAITTRDTFGNRPTEWLRAWRISPTHRFRTHEPPHIDGLPLEPYTRAETERLGLVFDHMAYATEAQIRFKVDYYGSKSNPLGHLYAPALEGWHRLQDNISWPARVADYLPFVNDESMCDRLTV